MSRNAREFVEGIGVAVCVVTGAAIVVGVVCTLLHFAVKYW